MTDLCWRKSSYSGNAEGECVEVGLGGGDVGVRDTKDPEGGALTVPGESWRALLAAVQD